MPHKTVRDMNLTIRSYGSHHVIRAESGEAVRVSWINGHLTITVECGEFVIAPSINGVPTVQVRK